MWLQNLLVVKQGLNQKGVSPPGSRYILISLFAFIRTKQQWLKLGNRSEANMNIPSESVEQTRCRELALLSSFYRKIYSEIEEVGWEQLVMVNEDLTQLSFQIIDKMGRVLIMEVTLDQAYPKCPPSIAADVPYIFKLQWSKHLRLKDVVQQFQELACVRAKDVNSLYCTQHLERLQEFWHSLDDVDQSLCVVEPKQPHRSSSHRQISIGNDCFIILSLNFSDPRSLPECHFMGPDKKVNSLRKMWRRNCKRWTKDKSIPENFTSVLDFSLPGPPKVQKNGQQTECGICYAQFLPIDDELGDKSGSGTDYTCENNNCSRAFHTVCLADWFHSITITRQSFDVLYGNCPCCSEPVAVRVDSLN